MTTSTLDLGPLLSLVTRERAAPLIAKREAASQARERPVADVADTAASAKTTNAEHGAPTPRAQLDAALERVSRLDQRLSFRVDEGSGKSVVVVSDARTSEVLKQFPSEEMLNVARRLEEHLQQSADAAGVLHSDEA